MQEIKDLIPKHMRGMAQAALQHAQYHAAYYSMDNPHWAEFSVLQAAHAFELFLKARISSEHPLLIFESLPKLNSDSGKTLTLEKLVQSGQTFSLRDLPSRLWVSCGVSVPNIDVFNKFISLRNSIQHFLPSEDIDFGLESLNFIYKVVDPFILEQWKINAIDFNEDSEPYEYLIPTLIKNRIEFTVSPFLVRNHSFQDFEWPTRSRYSTLMHSRWVSAGQLDG